MPEISTSERDCIMRRHERAMRLRCEYFKQATNPYVCGTGSAGHVFDDALVHFQAMRINHVEHFKPTARSLKYGILIALPIVLFGYAIKTERSIREEQFRTGQVAYKDRRFRFI